MTCNCVCYTLTPKNAGVVPTSTQDFTYISFLGVGFIGKYETVAVECLPAIRLAPLLLPLATHMIFVGTGFTGLARALQSQERMCEKQQRGHAPDRQLVSG